MGAFPRGKDGGAGSLPASPSGVEWVHPGRAEGTEALLGGGGGWSQVRARSCRGLGALALGAGAGGGARTALGLVPIS